MAGKLDFPLQGSSLYIVKNCGVALEDILDIKFGCVASFDGVNFEKDTSFTRQGKPATIAPEKRLEFELRTGVKVSVWKADLTNFPVDAVVNAANDRLQHYGGLALALSIAGGPQIQKESDDYIKNHGTIRTGDAVALGPGSLPCKKIIHAVGPELSTNPSTRDLQKAKYQLETAVKSILHKVNKLNLSTVAIPAISSGLFHYPLPDCADTIVSTVIKFCDKPYGQIYHPKEICLVNHDEPTVREIERACHQILGSHPSLIYNQPVRHQPKTFSQPAASSRKGSDKTSFSVQIGQVHLTLKEGHIEEQKTDVIVNTASPCLTLSIGQISNAILQKAGPEMQREIKTAVRKNNIICTKPYRLKCNEVYHTFCPDKRLDASAEWILQNYVSECLWTAAQSRHKSISFPAIGTGALGFRKEESARLMLGAVDDFAQKCSQRLEVFFVIFPSDFETFQVFRGQMNIFQQRASQHTFALETGNDNHASRAPSPQISLSGPTEESTREAEKWLSDLLSMHSRTVEIYNNFIQHFSEQDHLQLSRLTKAGVTIEEFFTQGHACIKVDGKSTEDAAIAALKVEAMLCKIQKDFISEEKQGIQLLSSKNISIERRPDDFSSSKFSDRKRAFRDLGLWVVKVEKVENPALNELFELKKKQLVCSTTVRMYQRIPAQFCEMIHNIGFHTEMAPPDDPAYGEGIYFAHSVKTAMKLWKENNDAFLYFVEAEVLKGKSSPGERGLILPPPSVQDPNAIYDSLSGGSDVSVIFSGYQALPKYIFICKKK